MLAQDSRFELAHAMLKALRDEEGCAPFVDTVVHVLRVDRFWAFCVDSERAALLWKHARAIQCIPMTATALACRSASPPVLRLIGC
jgi:hypothetical protein